MENELKTSSHEVHVRDAVMTRSLLPSSLAAPTSSASCVRSESPLGRRSTTFTGPFYGMGLRADGAGGVVIVAVGAVYP